MSRYKILNQHGINFVTITVVDWVDVFIRKSYKDIVIESLRYCQKEKGLVIYAFVIMSNHLHLVVEASDEKFPLSDVLRDFKKFTAKSILDQIKQGRKESRKKWMLERFVYRGNKTEKNQKLQLWKNDNHPMLLYTLPILMQKIRYIHANPVKAGMVVKAEHYLYSSASNYFLNTGILDVRIIESPSSWYGYVAGV
ncbi:MAG: transposase [Saprospiraceae bacterium]|nr:transposase [Saprospiraceae bacterium]MCB9343497.1 transposase [Lewinellaceae bacterium]